jgi:hypothetical protein
MHAGEPPARQQQAADLRISRLRLDACSAIALQPRRRVACFWAPARVLVPSVAAQQRPQLARILQLLQRLKLAQVLRRARASAQEAGQRSRAHATALRTFPSQCSCGSTLVFEASNISSRLPGSSDRSTCAAQRRRVSARAGIGRAASGSPCVRALRACLLKLHAVGLQDLRDAANLALQLQRRGSGGHPEDHYAGTHGKSGAA